MNKALSIIGEIVTTFGMFALAGIAIKNKRVRAKLESDFKKERKLRMKAEEENDILRAHLEELEEIDD